MIKETLIYSDYIIVSNKKSKIDPSKTINIEIGFLCPKCKKHQDFLDHSDINTCECGLKFQRFGNALYCELKEEI